MVKKKVFQPATTGLAVETWTVVQPEASKLVPTWVAREVETVIALFWPKSKPFSKSSGTSARKHRAFERARRQHADGHVGGAAYDRELLPRAHVDRAHAQPVGIGMRGDGIDACDDDVGERRRRGRGLLDFEA